MDQDTQRFFKGVMLGTIGGVIGWALLIWMNANIVGRV